jgi:hypothetical protein
MLAVGFTNPLLVNEDGVLIAGALGWRRRSRSAMPRCW